MCIDWANNMNVISAAFIILHYQSIDETKNCIESILSMNHSENLGIVVIDNASPNGTGQDLYERYLNFPNIVVYLNSENSGFSKANNLGCRIARDKWNPQFYIVTNNDIVFTQKNFISLISEKYDKYHFYILGPDILNIRQNVHQSPISKKAPTTTSSKKTIVLNYLVLKIYPIAYPLMKIWFKRLYSNAKDKSGYDIEQQDVCLQGACLIFSNDYINERGTAFYPETFFFAEEAIFTYWCEQNNKKTVYSPDLKVLHNESAATLSDKDMYRRIKFQMQNILDSTLIYLKSRKVNNR